MVSTKKIMGNTPLGWAVGGGHGAVVKLLLGAGGRRPQQAR